MIRFFDDNENTLVGLDLDETFAAILKRRYRDQPTRFEWGYNPDDLKQQYRVLGFIGSSPDPVVVYLRGWEAEDLS